jgi:hypothetical protein
MFKVLSLLILVLFQASETFAVEVYLSEPEIADGKVTFSLWYDDKMTKPVTFETLSTTHMEKVHAFVIDEALSYYTHLHPTEVNAKPGFFEFTWAPQSEETYKLWLDFLPKGSNESKVMSTILQKGKIKGVVKKENTLNVSDSGYDFKLIFDENPKPDEPLMAKIVVYKDKKIFRNLEPYLGAYAHITAFGDDFNSFIHTHPLGSQPKTDKQRGDGEILFHMEKLKKGYVKVFAQFKIDGKVVTVPFGFNVGEQ